MIIGIDIGTTHIKALLCTAAGKKIREAKSAVSAVQARPGYHEQDAGAILAAVIRLLRDAVAAGERVEAVCFSAAMHSLLAVDEKGEALTMAMTWADTRSQPQAVRLKKDPALADLYSITGVPVHPMSPLCKIAWLQEEQSEVYQVAARFVSIKEYLFFHLCGQWMVDYGMASATGMFDTAALAWSKPAMAGIGIGEEQLSTPVDPLTHFPLSEAGRKLLPALFEKTIFITGSSDGCLANLGSGAIGEEEAALTIGTSGAIRLLSKKKLNDPQQRLFTYRMNADYYLCGGAINNGGLAISWFTEAFGGAGDQDDPGKLLQQLEKIRAGSDGLVCLPYLTGERAPVWDAAAKASFTGVTLQHTRQHFCRALVEGICFSLRQIMEAIEENGVRLRMIHAGGGFTQTHTWVQILADILGKKISIADDADASVQGAVYLARLVTGSLENIEAIPQHSVESKLFIPAERFAEVYQVNYTTFSHLYQKLREIPET